MANLFDIADYCDFRTHKSEIPDFPGAFNGLQVECEKDIRKIGVTVDAGLYPFELAVEEEIDLLLCHHGLFWNRIHPITGLNYQKLQLLIENQVALYSSHLPLDCHPQIGNNALLARYLDLDKERTFLPYEGVDIGFVAEGIPRDELVERLMETFDGKVTAIEFGTDEPESIGILTGSGSSAVSKMRDEGIDTLITGELRQNHFNQAQEEGLNLYLCGHYATEIFGIAALAEEISKKFDIPTTFLETGCNL
jgi:dinuclear metal center YbgI/SA1388 family protein